MEKIEICNICNEEVQYLSPDAISYCALCESIVEGNTKLIAKEEN